MNAHGNDDDDDDAPPALVQVPPRIPVTIISGYLGAGSMWAASLDTERISPTHLPSHPYPFPAFTETTLLRHVMTAHHGKRIAVIQVRTSFARLHFCRLFFSFYF